MLKLTKGVGERVMLLNEETRRPVVVVVLWLSLGKRCREEERIMVSGCGDRRMQLRTEAERGRGGGGDACRWVSDLFMKRCTGRMEESFVVLGESTGLRMGGILGFWWR